MSINLFRFDLNVFIPLHKHSLKYPFMVYFIPIIYKIFIYNMLFMYYYESVSFYESFVKS